MTSCRPLPRPFQPAAAPRRGARWQLAAEGAPAPSPGRGKGGGGPAGRAGGGGRGRGFAPGSSREAAAAGGGGVGGGFPAGMPRERGRAGGGRAAHGRIPGWDGGGGGARSCAASPRGGRPGRRRTRRGRGRRRGGDTHHPPRPGSPPAPVLRPPLGGPQGRSGVWGQRPGAARAGGGRAEEGEPSPECSRAAMGWSDFAEVGVPGRQLNRSRHIS